MGIYMVQTAKRFLPEPFYPLPTRPLFLQFADRRKRLFLIRYSFQIPFFNDYTCFCKIRLTGQINRPAV